MKKSKRRTFKDLHLIRKLHEVIVAKTESHDHDKKGKKGL